MGTLIDKLNATNATKEEIRQAIERKDVDIPIGTPLKDYPSKIDGIYPDALFERTLPLPEVPETEVDITGVVYNDGVYIAFGTRNSVMFVLRKKAPSWEKYNMPNTIAYNLNMYSFNNLFIFVCDDTQQKRFTIHTSSDGVSWKGPIILEKHLDDWSDYHFRFIDTEEGTLYLFIENYDQYNRHKSIFYTTNDGINWTYKGVAFRDEFRLTPQNLTYDKSTKAFYLCKEKPDENYGYLYKSTDGKSRNSILKLDGMYECHPDDNYFVQSNGRGQLFVSYDSYESDYNYSYIYVVDVTGSAPSLITKLNTMFVYSYGSIMIPSGQQVFLLSDGLIYCHGVNFKVRANNYLSYIDGNALISVSKQGAKILYIDNDVNYFVGDKDVSKVRQYTYANGLLMAIVRTSETSDTKYRLVYVPSGISKTNYTGAYCLIDVNGEYVSNRILSNLFENNPDFLAISKNIMQAAYQTGVNSI